MRLTLMRAVLGLLVVTGGSGVAAWQMGLIALPQVGVQDMGDWTDVQGETFGVETAVWVDNPNPAGINISEVTADYAVALNGVELIRGRKEGVRVQEGNQTLTLASTLQTTNIPRWWAAHLERGEESAVEATAQVTVAGFPVFSGPVHTTSVETDIAGILGTALQEARGTYTGPGTGVSGVDGVVQPEVTVEDAAVAFGDVSPRQTPILMTFTVHNPNTYPVPVPELAGKLQMNDVTLAEWTGNEAVLTNPGNGVIAPGATQDLTFRVTMDNARIDDWLRSHIRNQEHTEGAFTVRLAFTFEDATLSLPRDGGMRCAFSVTTALLVDGQGSGGSFHGCSSGLLAPATGGDGSDGTLDGATNDSTTDTNDSSLLNGVTGNAPLS